MKWEFFRLLAKRELAFSTVDAIPPLFRQFGNGVTLTKHFFFEMKARHHVPILDYSRVACPAAVASFCDSCRSLVWHARWIILQPSLS